MPPSSEQHGLPKRWYPTTTLHGVIARKTITWSFTSAHRALMFTSDRNLRWPYNRSGYGGPRL